MFLFEIILCTAGRMRWRATGPSSSKMMGRTSTSSSLCVALSTGQRNGVIGDRCLIYAEKRSIEISSRNNVMYSQSLSCKARQHLRSTAIIGGASHRLLKNCVNMVVPFSRNGSASRCVLKSFHCGMLLWIHCIDYI